MDDRMQHEQAKEELERQGRRAYRSMTGAFAVGVALALVATAALILTRL